jgi:hypothetical protein
MSRKQTCFCGECRICKHREVRKAEREAAGLKPHKLLGTHNPRPGLKKQATEREMDDQAERWLKERGF